MSIVETLKRCELFLGLDDSDIQKIADLPSSQTREYESEEVIFHAGETANDLYVVEEGQVNLVLKSPASSTQPPGESVLVTITRGGIFGWGGLVPPHIRVGSAISKGHSRAICISATELRTLFDEHPQLGYQVMNSLVKVIGSRVWNLEQLLVAGKSSHFI